MLTNDSKPTCGILYIDDEEKALKYFRMAFSDKFKVFTASSGKDGLEILRRESTQIGIVISDQRMPEMLGAEILGIVREEFPGITRLLTTAYSDLDSAIQAVNQGHIYQYVVKPWEIPDLGMVLQRAADYHQILSERNELLALKMTTLQRIICSDRLKWLLLSSRTWDESSQSALRSLLLALISTLPETADALAPKKSDAAQFEIGNLIRGEYHNASRCLDAIDQSKKTPGAPEAALKAFINALVARYNLSADQAKLTTHGSSFELHLAGESLPHGELLKTVFGLLFERETSELSLLLLEALFAVAMAGGSLTVSAEAAGPHAPALSLALPLAQSATPSADEIIDALTAKFARWDLSRI